MQVTDQTGLLPQNIGSYLINRVTKMALSNQIHGCKGAKNLGEALMEYTMIELTRDGHVATLRLDRPKALNALCVEMMMQVSHALADLEKDDAIGCVILTGSEKAFAAGADIKEMQDGTYLDFFKNDVFSVHHGAIERFRKPIIAAVAGYALGGGCEIAMMCDFIIAADNVKFGQPEITLGVMPGIGGTQRLVRAVGKSKAMDMCLTGRMMEADEAERSGLVSRVVPIDELMDTALDAARKIAAQSQPVAMLTKEAIDTAFETTLSQGLLFEKRLFQSMFTFEDQTEGMTAFVEKRKAHFKHK
jgi:enoyl-CoA hydratase